MKSSDASRKKATSLTQRKYAPGLPRKEAAAKKLINSVGSRRNSVESLAIYLEWRNLNGLPVGVEDNLSQICNFLSEVSEGYSQTYLNQLRNFLSIAYSMQIPVFKSQVPTILNSRSYTFSDAEKIVVHQSERNALSSLISITAGVRAHEFATILRPDEAEVDDRSWHSELFVGLKDFDKYIVTGKGGLSRYVPIPKCFSESLASKRLDPARRLRDRTVFYDAHYDIGFGQAFSQSVTSASNAALGYSNGAHGFRHSYAKWRIDTLRKLGFSFAEALLIVSQEMGHFRPDILFAYLR